MMERPADKTHPRMLDLAALLEAVDVGRVALPDFQRDFEWSDSDVRALLATILRGWPAGSLLVMAGAPTYLRLRPIVDGPPLSSTVQWVVLDGQQRLTALYHALYNLGDSVYAIRIGDLDTVSVDSIEESLRTFAREDWEREYPDPGSQVDAELLPLYALRSAPDFYDWRDAATAGLSATRASARGKRLTALYREQLSGLHRYELPAVVVPTETEPAAIARIFERVNKSGVPLGAFDLMVATSYDAPWNLRDHWELARQELPSLDEFLGADGMPVLQVMALATSGDMRERAVLGLRGADVRANWSRAAEATDTALRFLRDACGVVRPEWLPYRNLVVVLGALAWDHGLQDRANRLLAWYWATSIGELYDVASNTRAVADFQALTRPTPGQPQRSVSRDSLRTAIRRAHGAFHRAFACALITSGAEDLVTGEALHAGTADIAIVSLAQPDWSSKQDPFPPHQRVMSHVLTTSRSRAALRRVVRGGDTDEIPERRLASQFLSNHELFPPTMFNFDSFVEERLTRLDAFLHRYGVVLTNLPTAPDG